MFIDESDEFVKHQPYSISDDDSSVITLLIQLKSGETVFFPYNYFAPTKLTKGKREQSYTLNLIGGGVNLVLHLKNFKASDCAEFCQDLAKRRVAEIREFSEELDGVEYPVFSKIEEVD